MKYEIAIFIKLSYVNDTDMKKCPFNKPFLYVYFIKTDILTFY